MSIGPSPITVLAVDDHAGFLDGIAALVNAESNMKFVAETSNVWQAIEQFEVSRPDATLTGLQMPGMKGIEANISVRSEFLERPRLVTGHRGSFRKAGEIACTTGTKVFPPFRLDTVNQCLWRLEECGGEERILLKPKAFGILKYLVDHAGRLVTQDELLDAVWPDTQVQPEVLKRHMLDIRHELGDDAKRPRFIETLARRGYQFIAPVREATASSAEPAATAVPVQTSLVGRDQALGELRGYLARTIAGHRQIVFVTGEPGIGKTSLVDEFQRQAGAGGGMRIARGQCVEGYGGSEPYYPILEALGNLGRGPGGDSVVQILAARAPTCLVQFPSLVKREQRETLQREIQGAARQRMLREISEALETIAAETPLVLVLEDLHWVDPSTVDLISALARGRGTAKLMVIGTYRPADLTLSGHPLKTVEQDLMVHHLCHEVVLEPLREREIAAYLASEGPDASQLNSLAGLLHRHSEGNPLFMVAALEHLTERGFVSRENGRWQLRGPVEEIDLEVPESLRQMIEIQIDRLSEPEHRALEAASVSGALFSVVVGAAAASMDVGDFEELCEGLSRRHYIVRSADLQEFPDHSASERYEFLHALYREVLYRRQSPGRRAKLHLLAGERLEALFAQRPGEAAAELAYHFEKGGDWLRAGKYQQLASDTAGAETGQAAEIRPIQAGTLAVQAGF